MSDTEELEKLREELAEAREELADTRAKGSSVWDHFDNFLQKFGWVYGLGVVFLLLTDMIPSRDSVPAEIEYSLEFSISMILLWSVPLVGMISIVFARYIISLERSFSSIVNVIIILIFNALITLVSALHYVMVLHFPITKLELEKETALQLQVIGFLLVLGIGTMIMMILSHLRYAASASSNTTE